MNTSSSNIIYILLFLERYDQNCQAVLAASGMKGLTGHDRKLNVTHKKLIIYYIPQTEINIPRLKYVSMLSPDAYQNVVKQ